MQLRYCPCRRRSSSLALILFLIGVPAVSRLYASQEGQTLDTPEPLAQALAEQVKHLNALVLELRAEISRSREETREIREELRAVLGRLPSAGGTLTQDLGPQSESSSSPEDRVLQLEESHQLLSNKIDEQYQTKVESASKYRVKLSGIALLNFFGNRGRVDNQDLPSLALRRGPTDTGGDFGATARQSQVGLEAYGPAFAGGRASADLHLDFFGGFPNTSDGVASGLVRLRTATVRLDWDRTSIIVGQDAPFFSPLSPSSVASLGYPALSYAGNLWTWIPQARVEHRVNFSEASSISVQAGFLDPFSGQPPSAPYNRTPGAGEKSRQPAYATRAAWTFGEPSRAVSLGAGGFYSRQNYGANRKEDAWAGTADWNVPIGNRIALSGEFYRGRALGGLGGAQGASVLFNGPENDPSSSLIGLNLIGGWTQLKFKASSSVEFNAAYGQDNPFGRDLRHFNSPVSFGYVLAPRNQSEMFNVIYRPRTDLVFSLEYRHLNTLRTNQQRNTANHLNLAVGVLF
jgi:hypothetical protein